MGGADGGRRLRLPDAPGGGVRCPGRCPKCGMALLARRPRDELRCPMHPDVTSDAPGRCPICGMARCRRPRRATGGAALTITRARRARRAAETPATRRPRARCTTTGHGRATQAITTRRGSSGKTTWSPSTGGPPRRTPGGSSSTRRPAPLRPIDWEFRVGDRVKLRLVNELDSDHPMHHPFHVHGAGRFVVLARDGVARTTSSGRTRCSCARARPSTSCST